jgi:transposase-like protein
VTDKLRSYGVAHREIIPETIHVTNRYANNRAEQSHEATRVRERGMRRFKSVRQVQRFLGAYAAVHNLFNLCRHLGYLSVTIETSGAVRSQSGEGRLLDNRIQMRAVCKS